MQIIIRSFPAEPTRIPPSDRFKLSVSSCGKSYLSPSPLERVWMGIQTRQGHDILEINKKVSFSEKIFRNEILRSCIKGNVWHPKFSHTKQKP